MICMFSHFYDKDVSDHIYDQVYQCLVCYAIQFVSDFVNVYATKLDNDLYVSHYTIKTQ